MSIASYHALVQSIKDHLVGHLLTDANVADFVALSEADFNRSLRLNRMITTQRTAPTSARFITLPGDWLQPVNIALVSGTNPRPLRVVSLDAAEVDARMRAGGTPSFYAITGRRLEIVPAPSSEVQVEMVYYAKIPALSTATQTNWLLADAPDLYLYNSLGHAASYIVDPQRQQLWRAESMRIVEALNTESKRSRRTGPLITRSREYAGRDGYR
jgi:hypothetical protein